MRYCSPLILTMALGLGGCASPAMPSLGFAEVSFPRVEMFEFGIPDRTVATTPYDLTPLQTGTIKATLTSAYPDGRVLRFGPISGRRVADGSIAVCGLVDVPNGDGSTVGMRLFDGTARQMGDGNVSFEPRRIAGRNAPSMDVYIACRDFGLI